MIYIVKYLLYGEMGVKVFLSRDKALKEFTDYLIGQEIGIDLLDRILGTDTQDLEVGRYCKISSSKTGQEILEVEFECKYVFLHQLKKPRKIKDWIAMINSEFEL